MAGYPDPIRFLGLSEWLANALGVSSLIAELITVLLILLVFFLPTFLMKTPNYLLSVLTIILMASLTGIGWLPFYTWVLLAIYLAYSVSGKMTGGS